MTTYIEYFNGHLYVGTLNRTEGAEIWKSAQPIEIPPEISNLNPDSGLVGTEVIISGSGFGTIQGTVTFNGIIGLINSWSESEIRAVVPLSATTGPIAVITSDGRISNGVLFTVNVPPPLVDLHRGTYSIKQVLWDLPDINNDGKGDLVEKKPFVVFVYPEVQNADSADKNRLFNIQLSFEGHEYPEQRTINEIEENNEIKFPPILPYVSGDQQIVIKVDADNVILESDEYNNDHSIAVSVKNTWDLNLMYIPIDQSITHSGYGPINMDVYAETAWQSSRFVEGCYPIAPEEFVITRVDDKFYGSPYQVFGTLHDASNIWLFGKLTDKQVDRVVGVVPSDYFHDYHYLPAIGLYYPGINGVLVRNGFWTVTAHEIGHSYGLRWRWPFGPGEEYDEFEPEPGKRADGFWVREEKEIWDGCCFMGDWHGYETFENPIWICRDDFIDMFKAFRVDTEDPEILLVSGILSKDGSVELGRFYRQKNGKLDYIIPGDYTLRIIGENKESILNIPFHTSFHAYVDPVGIVETDYAGFTLTIPYPKNSSKIQIFHKNDKLVEINPNGKLLHDAIDSIPQAGFVKNPDQRRKALHNKINEIEEKINQGLFSDAKNKLQNDVRDKLVKWLIEDYQVESPLQLSKQEILELVDEIIYRLGLR